MTKSNRIFVFIVFEFPVIASLLATINNSETLYAAGQWYAIFGNIMTVWSTIMMLIILSLFLLIIIIGAPLVLLAHAQINWACDLFTHLEQLFSTDNTPHDLNAQPVWEDVMENRLSYKASKTELICTTIQIGAMPIGATLVFIIISIFNY